MQGLPIHQLQKSVQGAVKGAQSESSKAAGAAKGNVENSQSEFASLFAGLTGKTSQVQSQPGEILNNLLAEKNAEGGKEGEGKVSADQAMVQQQGAEQLLQTDGQGKAKAVSPDQQINVKAESKMEQQIAKTTSSLDQLLNNLKGTQDYVPVEETETETEMPSLRNRSGDPSRTESKNDSPLDFLMKGAKSKGVTENTSVEADSQTSASQKKIVTGEDFIKNLQASEKKPALAVIQGQKADELLPAKMMNQNAKTYGQGINLMNDSLIKNTKDLANKDLKKGKQNISGIDELLATKETKAGAELASIRQEVIPTLQNAKESGNQSQLETNSNQKVLNLSHINSSNTTEIIKKISDYVEQNNVAGKQSLDLTVKHDSLGEFKIQVSKLPDSMNKGLNQIDMQITTSSKEGHDFFVKHEVSLMKNLNQAGINLSDLRIVASMSESTPFGQSDSRQSSSFQHNQDGSRQFSSFESNSFSSEGGSQRRKELWEEYQQRYGA